MRRREFCLGLVAMPALARSALAQEVSSITLIKQHGLPYLPMMLMEEFKLVEKHAARLGVAQPQDRLPHARRHAVDHRCADRRVRCISASRACRALRRCGTRPPGTRERSARALRRAGDAVHPHDQPARDQVDQGLQGRPQDRGAGREELQPGDLPADGGREGVGTGELRAARSVHHHAAASGRRDCDHLAGRRSLPGTTASRRSRIMRSPRPACMRC